MPKKELKGSLRKNKSQTKTPVKKSGGVAGKLPATQPEVLKQFDILSNLSFLLDEKGNVLACGKPQNIPGVKKNIFTKKNLFLYYRSVADKEKFLKEITTKKNKTISLDLEYASGKEIPVITRWLYLPGNRSGENHFLVLNFVIDGLKKKAYYKNDGEIQGEFTWHSPNKVKDRNTEFSENLVSVTGYTKTEIKRKPEGILSLIHKDDYENIRKQYESFVSASKQNNLRVIYRLERKDKKVIWVKEIVSVKRDKKGNTISSSGVISDVTDLMKADEALVNSIEHLKKLNASKDKFISMLSHDLRAPFTSILGFAEILINEQALSATEKLEYLTYIHESSQNQLQLINYLLDWSRLQTGRMKFEPQRLHAQSVVFNCVSSLTGNAIRKNIDIKVKVNENIFIQADERLISQVITNLLSNAIKFSSTDKTIDISAELFNDELIEFIVKDEGTGITDENKNKLFKIERMFSTAGTKGEKGTGLGLSLVKEIVEKHGGNIWFYSEFGRGSDFHFTVPLSPNIILLVDESEEDKSMIEKIIKKNFPEFQVIGTSNGYQAMSIVLNKLPSLVVTEHEMPLMSGNQLIESIRREEKNYRIPIILLTDSDIELTKKVYHNVSVFEIFQKPVNTDLFIEKLDSALKI